MLELFWGPYANTFNIGEPALQISVKTDVEKALKDMSRLHKKQMPFAAALGLTNDSQEGCQGRTTHDGAGTGQAHAFHYQRC